MNTTQRPTPETDALHLKQGLTHASYREFARKLERERDEAREELENILNVIPADAPCLHAETGETVDDYTLLSAIKGYKSLGWANQYTNNQEFWSRYHSLKWEILVQTNNYTLEACHETKEFLETDSSD